MPWGVDRLSIAQRYVMALEAGTNMFAGNADPTQLIQTLKTHPGVMSLVDESVALLLMELFQLGLFENPYVDEAKAVPIVNKEAFVQAGKQAQRKSIVLLRNEGAQLPLAPNTKVYFEDYQKSYHKPAPGRGTVYVRPKLHGQYEKVNAANGCDKPKLNKY
jgi:beta-glucosidase